MNEFWKDQWKALLVMLGSFLACFYLPMGWPRFENSVLEALHLVRWYAREHVLLCLVPAFFIAGAIATFVSQASVMKYLGPSASKVCAYGVASCTGTILAVCSCTILPLFAGIYRMGAGLGPATTFLYAGPAINILAIILTARVLGPELGIARAVGAVLFSVVIGLIMHLLYRNEEFEKTRMAQVEEPGVARPLWQTSTYFASMVAILVFANWGRPQGGVGFWQTVFEAKWMLAGAGYAVLAFCLASWFGLGWRRVGIMAVPVIVLAVIFPSTPEAAFVAGVAGLSAVTSIRDDETGAWFKESWSFAKQIMPLLLFGVIAAGMLMGRPGNEGLIPSEWVTAAVGGNSLASNFIASFAGAFMYFATLTEVPILQGLIGNGMGKGPALALLLAGPALSLPSMLVIRSVMGTQKTIVFVSLVVIMATISGLIYGALMG